MITIFTSPRPFIGHHGIIQKNAIRSWLQLDPQPQVLLMGNDAGTRDVCAELGVTHVPNIQTNEFGTPLMDSMLQEAEALARNNLLLLVASDTVLFNDIFIGVQVLSKKFKKFCVVSGRQHVNLQTYIDFKNSEWESYVREKATPTTKRDLKAGDFFLFPKGFWGKFPAFTIGRTVCDNWMFYYTLSNWHNLIDATKGITTIHQDHEYYHHPDGEDGVRFGIEAQRNRALVENNPDILGFSREYANWQLTPQGLQKHPFTWDRHIMLAKSVRFLHPAIWPLVKKYVALITRLRHEKNKFSQSLHIRLRR